MLIRLQRIYNFLLFHAILYSVLDIIELYYTLLYYFWDYPISRRPGPELLFFCLFQSFAEKEYQTESKRNETFGNVIFRTNVTQRTWTLRQDINQEGTR